uniref:Uncharacterized protein n=1 Tax=Anguilla anguilla TaxID=7936 RepID=A0A0E9T3S0_ANGAN
MCCAPTWTPGFLLTPDTPMGRPSPPSTSARHLTSQTCRTRTSSAST